MTPIEIVLARLEGVRRAHGGWIARCPAHADRGPSLSISEAESGAALIHCFAGCDIAAVVTAAGLTMADLFPLKPTCPDLTPAQRAERRLIARQAQWAAAVRVLDFEAAITQAGVAMVRRRTPITDEDEARLALAAQRIADARQSLGVRA